MFQTKAKFCFTAGPDEEPDERAEGGHQVPPSTGYPPWPLPEGLSGMQDQLGPGVPLTPRSRHLFVQNDIARGAELPESLRGKQLLKEWGEEKRQGPSGPVAGDSWMPR